MNNARTNNSLSENISKSFIQEAQPLDIIKGFQDSSAILEKLEENLEKGLISDEEFEKALSTLNIISKGGEGSKGGKVIGHTKSGKPIYDKAGHASHADFTKEDHYDAATVHKKIIDQSHQAMNAKADVKTDKYRKEVHPHLEGYDFDKHRSELREDPEYVSHMKIADKHHTGMSKHMNYGNEMAKTEKRYKGE